MYRPGVDLDVHNSTATHPNTFMAKQLASILAAGVSGFRFVTSPTAKTEGALTLLLYLSTCTQHPESRPPAYTTRGTPQGLQEQQIHLQLTRHQSVCKALSGIGLRV